MDLYVNLGMPVNDGSIDSIKFIIHEEDQITRTISSTPQQLCSSCRTTKPK